MTYIQNALTLETVVLPIDTSQYIIGAIYDLPQTEAKGRQDFVQNLHRYLKVGKWKEKFIHLIQLRPTIAVDLVRDALACRDSTAQEDVLELQKKMHEEFRRVETQQRKLDETIDCCQTVNLTFLPLLSFARILEVSGMQQV